MNTHRESYGSASACGGQAISPADYDPRFVGGKPPIAGQAEPRPMTRLEAAHETEFRALMRLRDMAKRAEAIAVHLVGPKPPKDGNVAIAGAGAESDRPLVRRIEETSSYLHEAIDEIEEALDRLGSL